MRKKKALGAVTDPAHETSRKRAPVWLAGLLCIALVELRSAGAAEFTGYVTLTTDYVFRGVTYSDSHAAFQLGGDIAFASGFYLGAWASTVDISNGPARQRDLEVDYYAGYLAEVSDRWSISGNIVSYTFPGAEGEFDYDYVEYSVAANYDDRVWLSYAYSPDLFHTGSSTHNVELFAEMQLGWQMTLGSGAGFYDVSDVSGSDYTYWQIGVTRPLGQIDVDLRYFDSNDWVPIVSTPDRADGRVVLSLRYAF